MAQCPFSSASQQSSVHRDDAAWHCLPDTGMVNPTPAEAVFGHESLGEHLIVLSSVLDKFMDVGRQPTDTGPPGTFSSTVQVKKALRKIQTLVTAHVISSDALRDVTQSTKAALGVSGSTKTAPSSSRSCGSAADVVAESRLVTLRVTSIWVVKAVLHWTSGGHRGVLHRMKHVWLRSRNVQPCIAAWIIAMMSVPDCARALLSRGLDDWSESKLSSLAHALGTVIFVAASILEEPGTWLADANSAEKHTPPLQVHTIPIVPRDGTPSAPASPSGSFRCDDNLLPKVGALFLLQSSLCSLARLHQLVEALLIPHMKLSQICTQTFKRSIARLKRAARIVVSSSSAPPVLRSLLWNVLTACHLAAGTTSATSDTSTDGDDIPFLEQDFLDAFLASHNPHSRTLHKRQVTEQALIVSCQLLLPVMERGGIFGRPTVRSSAHQTTNRLAHGDKELIRRLLAFKAANVGNASSSDTVLRSVLEFPLGREGFSAFMILTQGDAAFVTRSAAADNAALYAELDVWLFRSIRESEAKLLSCVLLPRAARIAIVEPLARHGCNSLDFKLFGSILSASAQSAVRASCDASGKPVVAQWLLAAIDNLFERSQQLSVAFISDGDDHVGAELQHVLSALMLAMQYIQTVDVPVQLVVLKWIVASVASSAARSAKGACHMTATSTFVVRMAFRACECPVSTRALKHLAVNTAFRSILEAAFVNNSILRRYCEGSSDEVRVRFLRRLEPFHPPLIRSFLFRLQSSQCRNVFQPPGLSVSQQKPAYHEQTPAKKCPYGSGKQDVSGPGMQQQSPFADGLDAEVVRALAFAPLSVLIPRLTVVWVTCIASYGFPRVPLKVSSRVDAAAVTQSDPVPVKDSCVLRRQNERKGEYLESCMDTVTLVLELCHSAAVALVPNDGGTRPQVRALEHFLRIMVTCLAEAHDDSDNPATSWKSCPYAMKHAVRGASRHKTHPQSAMVEAIIARLTWLHNALFASPDASALLQARPSQRQQHAVQRELCGALSKSSSAENNRWIVCHFLADLLSASNRGAAWMLRAVGIQTPLLTAVLPRMLPTRVTLRMCLACFDDDRAAAAALRELGQAALSSMRSWMMDGLPVHDEVAFFSPSGTPFCAVGVRCKAFTDLLELDIAEPLHCNEWLRVVQQVSLQIIDALCRDNLRQLGALLGGTSTTDHLIVDRAKTASASSPTCPVGTSIRSMMASVSAELTAAMPEPSCPFRLTKTQSAVSNFVARGIPAGAARTAASSTQSNSAHATSIPRISDQALDESRPLNALAAVQLAFEEALWRCRLLMDKPSPSMCESLINGCHVVSRVVEPWAAASTLQPYKLVSMAIGKTSGVCPFFKPSSAGIGMPHHLMGKTADLAAEPWAAASAVVRSSAVSPMHTFLIGYFPWWCIAPDDLVTARWVMHGMLTLLAAQQFGSFSKHILLLGRARAAVLCLLRTFGGALFHHCCKDRLSLRTVPCTVWLPLVEELLQIAIGLMIAGDKDGSSLVEQIITDTAAVYPQQVVWPLLFAVHFAAAHGLPPHVARIPADVLTAVSRSSKETQMCVEVATRVHRLFRVVAVLPMEQLDIDVRNLYHVYSTISAVPAEKAVTDASDAPVGAIISKEHVQQVWDTAVRHLKQFRERKPTTELERYLRVELLPFTEQLLDAMKRCNGSVQVLIDDEGEKLRDLKDRIEAVLASHLQIAWTSLVAEGQYQQLCALLSLHGVVLLDMRDALNMCPELWGSHRRSVVATVLEPLVTTFPSAQRPKRLTFGIPTTAFESRLSAPRFAAAQQTTPSGSMLRCHFLVKGREDLRQDQRCQRILRVFAQITRTHLSTYSVIALSPTCGLVEWVANSETMGRLVQQYRGLAGMPMNREGLIFAGDHQRQNMFQNYDDLPPSQKLEIFRQLVPPIAADDAWLTRNASAADTGGRHAIGGVMRPLHCELRNMMLHVAGSAAAFLANRNAFTKSLASMSVLGHIIGLGDRHPANILIDRNTFHITHIDFGDAFERARKRRKLPECVPFRATRMLERCLDVNGFSKSDGLFFSECVQVAEFFASTNVNSGHCTLLFLESLMPFVTDIASPRSHQLGWLRGVAERIQSYRTHCTTLGDIAETMACRLAQRSPSWINGIATMRSRLAASRIQRWWRRVVQSRYFVSVGQTSSSEEPLSAKLPSTHSRGSAQRISGASGCSRDRQRDRQDPLLDAVIETHTYPQWSSQLRPQEPGCSPQAVSVCRSKTLSRNAARHLSELFDDACPYQRGAHIKAAVATLIAEATSDVNLSRHFSGWMPFW